MNNLKKDNRKIIRFQYKWGLGCLPFKSHTSFFYIKAQFEYIANAITRHQINQERMHMNMMKKVCGGFALIVLVALVLLVIPPMAEAVTCSPVELSPCLGAITSSSPPSTTCCQKVREQRPCLCGYLKNPSLRPYVNSPGSRRVASSCGVPFPTC